MIWNPWREKATQMTDLGSAAWQGMLCVESANVGRSRVTLAAGEAHRLRVAISVEARVGS